MLQQLGVMDNNSQPKHFSLQQKNGEPTENAEECPVVPVLSAPVSSLQGLHESNPKAHAMGRP
jgi:hypothetical protein